MKVRVGVAPGAPSATLGASMKSVGVVPSSSTTVPVPVTAPEARVALVGPLNVTAMVSSCSSVVSPVTVTSIVCVVVPAAKVSVPAARAV